MVSKGSWTKVRKTRSEYTVLRFRIKGSKSQDLRSWEDVVLDLGERVLSQGKEEAGL